MMNTTSLILIFVFAFGLGYFIGFNRGRQVTARKARKDGFKERLIQETFKKSPLNHEYSVDVAEEAESAAIKALTSKQSARYSGGCAIPGIIFIIALIFFLEYFDIIDVFK